MNYKSHPIIKILSVRVVAPFTLELRFDDGRQKIVNLHSILKGELYGPLADETLFNQVAIDEEVHTITWPNGADFDPATLYNWESSEKELSERSKTW